MDREKEYNKNNINNNINNNNTNDIIFHFNQYKLCILFPNTGKNKKQTKTKTETEKKHYIDIFLYISAPHHAMYSY